VIEEESDEGAAEVAVPWSRTGWSRPVFKHYPAG